MTINWRLIRALMGLVLFLSVTTGDIFLLMAGEFKPQEAIALFLATFVLSLVLYLLPEVQELSLGGQVLKIREAKKEVDDTLAKIKKIQIATYRGHIRAAMKLSGGFSSAHETVDDRADDLFYLYEEIKDNSLGDELKGDLHRFSKATLDSQVLIVRGFSRITEDEIRQSKNLMEDALSKANDLSPQGTVRIVESTEGYAKIHKIFEATKPT